MTRTWPTGGPSGCWGVVDMAVEATARPFFGTRATASVAQPPKNGPGSAVLDGAAAERGRGRALLAVADVADLDRVARLGGGDDGPDVGAVLHRLAVDLDDEV